MSKITSDILYLTDGAYLAVGSHDNFVYIYSVTENGRKYSRVGKCTVSLTEKLLQHLFKNLIFYFNGNQLGIISTHLIPYLASVGTLQLCHSSRLVHQQPVYCNQLRRLWDLILWVVFSAKSFVSEWSLYVIVLMAGVMFPVEKGKHPVGSM